MRGLFGRIVSRRGFVSGTAGKTTKTINYLTSDCVVYYLQEACNGIVPEEYADPAGQGRIEVIV